MAVGARPADVLWLVLRRALAVVSLGLVIGLPAALALSRALDSQLFHVAPTDPATYLGVTAVLLGVGGIAAVVPARRAAATDPLNAIRHE
jgi:ABC-type antimicrobial peptide transport system permease subunit